MSPRYRSIAASLSAFAVLVALPQIASGEEATTTEPPASAEEPSVEDLPTYEDDPENLIAPDDIPEVAGEACDDFARQEAEDPSIANPWLCLESEVTETLADGSTETTELVETPDGAEPAEYSDTVASFFFPRSVDGPFAPDASETVPALYNPLQQATTLPARVIDGYHSRIEGKLYWSVNQSSGYITFNINTALAGRSADVAMNYFSQNGKPIILNWRLRLRQHVGNLRPDNNIFNFPATYGPGSARASYSVTEGRYGAGHNKPPPGRKNLFYDAYGFSVRVNGTKVAASSSVQSDRFNCTSTRCTF
ncbi:hypothetical protein [Aeromicrobium alkaliterrae]|uniref:Uncharacterized protein n=1 Tax=Aeromicrobium alkaliterrae TaxID=302168 RepID=A0ABP4WIM0_9ACTN